MEVSGLSLIRRGVDFDYPFEASIASLLPFVSECVVMVGRSEDETEQKLRNWAGKEPKLKIHVEDWDLSLRGGKVLSQITNKGLSLCRSDWVLMLQADEVLHEKDSHTLLQSLQDAALDARVEGLLFHYCHLYGSPDWERVSRRMYRQEVRAIRRSSGARSVGDAQSFRMPSGRKPDVVDSKVTVYHYGWARSQGVMRKKTYFMDQLYHGAPSLRQQSKQEPHTGQASTYKLKSGVQPFSGTHPKLIKPWVKRQERPVLKPAPYFSEWKDRLLDSLEVLTKKRFFEYRSFRLLPFPFERESPGEALPLSVVCITLQARTYLPRLLESVKYLAGEVLIYDAGSTDGTCEMAEKWGARVIQAPWQGYGAQKEAASRAAHFSWILNLDADEWLSPKAVESIRTFFKHERDTFGAGRLRRLNFFANQPIKAWSPNLQVRLYNKEKAHWSVRPLHERVETKAPVFDLSGTILHDPFSSLEGQAEKNVRYACLGQRESASVLGASLRAMAAFWRFYGLKGGWKSGRLGVVLGIQSAYSEFLRGILSEDEWRRTRGCPPLDLGLQFRAKKLGSKSHRGIASKPPAPTPDLDAPGP